MNDTHKEPNQKALPGPTRRGPSRPGASKDSGRQAIESQSGDLTSPLPYEDAVPQGLISGLDQRKANGQIFAIGDILVDVDAGPGGTGLVVWIVGG